MPYYHIFAVQHAECPFLTFDAYVVTNSERPFDDDVELECPTCKKTFRTFVSSTKCALESPDHLPLARIVE